MKLEFIAALRLERLLKFIFPFLLNTDARRKF
jgi:hypothetical protein